MDGAHLPSEGLNKDVWPTLHRDVKFQGHSSHSQWEKSTFIIIKFHLGEMLLWELIRVPLKLSESLLEPTSWNGGTRSWFS